MRDEEPLFLPGTQLSQALRESGLGLESMTAGEFAAMLEGDAEEVEFDEDSGGREASLEIVDGEEDVEMEMAPTQPGGGAKVRVVSEVCVLGLMGVHRRSDRSSKTERKTGSGGKLQVLW